MIAFGRSAGVRPWLMKCCFRRSMADVSDSQWLYARDRQVPPLVTEAHLRLKIAIRAET